VTTAEAQTSQTALDAARTTPPRAHPSEGAVRRREIAAVLIGDDDTISMANVSGMEYLRLFAPQGNIALGQILPDNIGRLISGLREDLLQPSSMNSSLITLPDGVCLRGSLLNGKPHHGMLVLFEPVSRLDERRLSPRELEVATLVLNGLSNREIAARLCVAHHTVEGHLKRIFSKMQVRSRAGLVAKMLGWHSEDSGRIG
jgi:DNA-binding CsgD family transcriptional regulator